MADLETGFVVRRHALLEREDELPVFGLAVWLLAVKAFVDRIEGVAESS